MTVFGVRTLAVVLVALTGAAACSKPVEVAAGPPCVAVDAATFAASPYKTTAKASFVYGGVTYARALGNADCADVTGPGLGFTKYAVCDFTSPAVLDVQLEGGQHLYYTPGVGKPVRVSFKDKAAPTCELVSK